MNLRNSWLLREEIEPLEEEEECAVLLGLERINSTVTKVQWVLPDANKITEDNY